MRRDQGYAAVILTVLMALAVVMCAAVAFLGGIAAARVRATTAADLASLAAARHVDCLAAGPVASTNEAELISCEVQGQDVVVTVRVPVRIPGGKRYVIAGSRAGPP